MKKNEVTSYYESVMHEQEVEKLLEQARLVVASQNSWHNKAVVFDIDETSLNHYYPFKEAGFPQDENHQIWHELISSTKVVPIRATLDFYLYCLDKGLKVFFISARFAKYLDSTKQALQNAGYTDFEDVFVFPENITEYKSDKFKNFKEKKRAFIESLGYKVLMSIGDQPSDLVGGFTEYVFKLPNYLYGKDSVFK